MYVEFRCKTNFSFLRGASSAKDYVRRALELNLPALCISDINGVYAIARAYEAIREIAPSLRLICGSELRLQSHAPITLIPRTRQAYGLMCRLISKAHEGKEKGEGSLSLFELSEWMQIHSGRSDLVCIADVDYKNCDWDWLKSVFKDNLYIPLVRYQDGLDEERTLHCENIAIQYHLKILASNDVHYHEPERRCLQDALTCIREGTNLDQAGFLLFGNSERYLKSYEEMRELFADHPEALQNTRDLAESCVFHLSELKYSYPHEFIPFGETAHSYLKKLVYSEAETLYKGLIPISVQKQIEKELAFFAKRGDEHYFLTVYDIVRFAKENNIYCQGRGSAANSVVCYILGITSVDPVEMGLLFDRFMNEGRPEPPDIDVDFEHQRREEVIQYIYQRFGRERAAMVAAVRTYRKRSAFLELAKAVGVEVGTISSSALQQNFDELAKEKKDRKIFIETLAEELKGFPRHLSIHSGGFVLSNDPLCEIVPIEPARLDNRTIVQWDKDDLETLGLMKIDVLSIGFLTALHKAADLAKINWRDIPSDDKATYEMIGRAETHGTFQIESRAQMVMLQQTRPQNFYELVIQVALVRPSPTEGGMVQPFLKGLREARQGRRFKIGHPILEKILDRTHGVPLFQEQIMQISMEVAGFSAAEADGLRRFLVKQRSAVSIEEMRDHLYKSLIEQKTPREFADRLFKYIQGYAHYGFPESHAASYASLAYKSAYMKCHHPAELLCGLINSQPMGFYPIDTLINEAKKNGSLEGVKFLRLSPHYSHWETELVAPKTLRMGFSHLRKVQREMVDEMVRERNIRAFTSLEDFLARTHFPKDVIENLAMAGVFEEFGLDRRHSFWKSLEVRPLIKTKEESQMSLFNENSQISSREDLFSPMNLRQEIVTDYRKLGYSLSGHLMKALRAEDPTLPPLRSLEVKKQAKGCSIQFAGIVTVLQRPPPAKGTVFMTLEDELGSIDTVIRSEVYEKFADLIKATRFLIIEGEMQRRGGAPSVLIKKVQAFSSLKNHRPQGPGPHPRSLPSF